MAAALLERAAPVTTNAFERIVAGAVQDRFASGTEVRVAGALVAESVGLVGRRYRPGEPGQRFHLALSPGTVGLRVESVTLLHLVGEDHETGSDPLEHAVRSASRRPTPALESVLFELEPTRRAIREFSRGARRRMVRTIAELDYSGWHEDGGCLAMVTLTFPGWWERVAPDGAHAKRLLRLLRERWVHVIGPWRGLWKLEFQRRGAPHFHMLMRIPAMVGDRRFEEWLSETWAELVFDSMVDSLGYPARYGYNDGEQTWRAYVDLGEYDKHLSAGTGVDFSGVKFSDPRRTAIYFLKHSSKTLDDKEYQHVVPDLWAERPGRFWGYWGLDRARTEVELDRAAFVRARRILRGYTRSREAVVQMNRIRASGEGSVWSMRRPRFRAGFGSRGGGWVIANDGLGLAFDLARALQT